MTEVIVALAYLVDLAVGDPPRLPHPVAALGKLIELLERLLYRPGGFWSLAGGALMALAVVGFAYGATALLIYGLGLISPWLAVAAQIWLVSTTLAARGLAGAAGDVLKPLIDGDLQTARNLVARIVGRETSSLDSAGVTRAAVETVAENTVDGVIAPLFYALLGGAPLAMAYRAVNTLDSMVGYKNERYLHFGRFSARLDDAANYIPARICGLTMLAAAWITGRRAGLALRVVVRDARKHPSPNSGIAEAAMAGALGVRLGGLNVYGGRESFREYMGDSVFPLIPGHIRQAADLMYLSSFLALAIGVLARAALEAAAGMLS
ncbi:MAG: adenosylcobinamide-phosphate synthase CbiB [Actinobacteria bacterium]|nr:adenosylcobinamide-phosphate synthase CbiB [Actinomycetota bacterium]